MQSTTGPMVDGKKSWPNWKFLAETDTETGQFSVPGNKQRVCNAGYEFPWLLKNKIWVACLYILRSSLTG